jgi:hypothetical protein
MAVLRTAGKAVAAVIPAAQLARLGLPALLGVIGLAVLVLAAVCWILASDARCENAAKVLRACRGVATAVPVSAPAPARAHWLRRRKTSI